MQLSDLTTYLPDWLSATPATKDVTVELSEENLEDEFERLADEFVLTGSQKEAIPDKNGTVRD